MSYCQDHPQCPISLICINPHKCQQNRKLCVRCLRQHGFQPEYSIPAEEFPEIVQQKLNIFEPFDLQLKQKIEAGFKLIVEKLEKKIKKIQDELIQKLHNCFKLQYLKDQFFHKLIDQSVHSLTNTQLNKIVDMIYDNAAIQKWQYITSSLSNQIIDAISKIEESIDSFNQEKQEFQQDRQKEQNCLIFDSNSDRFINKKIKIKYQRDQIEYQRDGQIIKMQQIYSNSKNENIQNIQQNLDEFPNLEKICHLNWIGQYGQKNKRKGKWIANWKGEYLFDVGGLYLDDGKKTGQWKELSKNFCSKGQVFEIGEYNDNQKAGTWKQIYNNKEIGKGEYNEKGQKHGNWREISDGFWDQSSVIHEGKYLNGVKIDCWDIYSINNKLIGGGSYEQICSGNKTGQWIEISDRFYNQSQVTYQGWYKNGKKYGRWDILYGNKQIGGGLYDEEFNGNKMGLWEELFDGYYKYSQVTYKGDYKKGEKVGEWKIWQNQNGNNKQIGGGLYDNKGNGSKLGNWVELSDAFCEYSQVTYKGEYQNGVKVGEWDVWYNLDGQNQMIGGGKYDENGTKVGIWVELSDGFYQNSQVTYKGEYKIGEKVGRWDIWYIQQGQNQKIGGGSYDEKGSGIKLGNWMELSDQFHKSSQVTYKGDYKNGKKVGQWDAWHDKTQIGRGQYDENCMKVGSWIELSDEFQNESKVIYKGSYVKGNKVNKWDILCEGKVIGGGQYDDKGHGIKIRDWVEEISGFTIYHQVICQGSYVNGKKVGTWTILIKDDSKMENDFQKLDEQYYDN